MPRGWDLRGVWEKYDQNILYIHEIIKEQTKCCIKITLYKKLLEKGRFKCRACPTLLSKFADLVSGQDM